MPSTSLPLTVVVLTSLNALGLGGVLNASAQPAQPASRVESSLSVTSETFCSDTKLRTTNARIRWSLPRAALTSASLTSLAAARQTLEVTVYKNGFDNGQLIAIPIGPASPDRPVAPLPQTGPGSQLRAYQIRLIELEQPPAAPSADAPSAMGAVVEDLEPGVNYTLRVAIDSPGGRLVSPPTRVQARVCPADLAETPDVPKRRP